MGCGAGLISVGRRVARRTVVRKEHMVINVIYIRWLAWFSGVPSLALVRGDTRRPASLTRTPVPQRMTAGQAFRTVPNTTRRTDAKVLCTTTNP